MGRLAMAGSLLLLVMIHCLGLLCAFVAFFLFVVGGYCGCVYIRFGFVFRLLLLGMISAVWCLVCLVVNCWVVFCWGFWFAYLDCFVV